MANGEPDWGLSVEPLQSCSCMFMVRNAAYLEEDAQVVALLAQLQQRHRPLIRRVLRLVHTVGAVYK